MHVNNRVKFKKHKRDGSLPRNYTRLIWIIDNEESSFIYAWIYNVFRVTCS